MINFMVQRRGPAWSNVIGKVAVGPRYCAIESVVLATLIETLIMLKSNRITELETVPLTWSWSLRLFRGPELETVPWSWRRFRGPQLETVPWSWSWSWRRFRGHGAGDGSVDLELKPETVPWT